MSIGLLFWILMILWVVLGVVVVLPAARGGQYAVAGNSLLLFILLALLGWQVFGPILRT